jgi:hypothetical protein
MLRMHGNVVQQQIVWCRHEDESADKLPLCFRHPDLMAGNFLGIVGKHGARRLPQAWNIVAVSYVNAACQRRRIGRGSAS